MCVNVIQNTLIKYQRLYDILEGWAWGFCVHVFLVVDNKRASNIGHCSVPCTQGPTHDATAGLRPTFLAMTASRTDYDHCTPELVNSFMQVPGFACISTVFNS